MEKLKRIEIEQTSTGYAAMCVYVDGLKTVRRSAVATGADMNKVERDAIKIASAANVSVFNRHALSGSVPLEYEQC